MPKLLRAPHQERRRRVHSRRAVLHAIFASSDDGPHFLPDGICPTVGVGGLTLGGGIGHNTLWAALTCDHMQQTRIVSARGEPLNVTPSQHSDLFWALSGGAGGSFGVNTAFTFDLAGIPTRPVPNFSINWRGADAAGLDIRAFQALMQQAPPVRANRRGVGFRGSTSPHPGVHPPSPVILSPASPLRDTGVAHTTLPTTPTRASWHSWHTYPPPLGNRDAHQAISTWPRVDVVLRGT